MDSNSHIIKETDNFTLKIHTQILDEPNSLVILIHKKIINKKTGKTETIKIYREQIDL
jgi:hypothetical protein